jgi:hypothetical protein
MSAQLVTKFKRADPNRAELTTKRASQRATSILSCPSLAAAPLSSFVWPVMRGGHTLGLPPALDDSGEACRRGGHTLLRGPPACRTGIFPVTLAVCAVVFHKIYRFS